MCSLLTPAQRLWTPVGQLRATPLNAYLLSSPAGQTGALFGKQGGKQLVILRGKGRGMQERLDPSESVPQLVRLDTVTSHICITRHKDVT